MVLIYIVRFLHHPGTHGLEKVTKKFKHPGWKHGWAPTQVRIANTFSEVFFEYYGDPSYDVTPYNQRTCIVMPFPPRRLGIEESIELCKKMPNWGDELLTCVFDEKKKLKACLRISMNMFTLDWYDPRKRENWDEIVENISNIQLEFYDEKGELIPERDIKGDTYYRDVNALVFSDNALKDIEEAEKEGYERLEDARKINKLIKILCDDFCLYAINKKYDEWTEKHWLSPEVVYGIAEYEIKYGIKNQPKRKKVLEDVFKLLNSNL